MLKDGPSEGKADDAKKHVGEMQNIFPGCNCRCLGGDMTSNYILKFPPSASGEDRALMLGGLFLQEFLHFERKEENNQ